MMMDTRNIEILTNACFQHLIMQRAIWVHQIEIILIFSENKAVIMLDCSGNRSKPLIMQIAKPLFEFPHILLIPVVINNHQWNCCIGIMANVLHIIDDTECEDFFRMNMDKNCSWFHQKLLHHYGKLHCKNTNILCSFFDYNIFSFRNIWWVENDCKIMLTSNITCLDSYSEWNPEACHSSDSKC